VVHPAANAIGREHVGTQRVPHCAWRTPSRAFLWVVTRVHGALRKASMEHLTLFSTPVIVFDLPQMETVNTELVTRLLDEEQRAPGLRRSNHGGWHSDWGLEQRSEPCFQTLMRSMREHVSRAAVALVPDLARSGEPETRVLQAWAMIMRDGHYAVTHDHGKVTWSVVYYADCGDGDEPSGELAFTDPRVGVRPLPGVEGGADLFLFQPRTSALVVFPGWLKHQVFTYCGSRPRISIAANLSMTVAASERMLRTA